MERYPARTAHHRLGGTCPDGPFLAAASPLGVARREGAASDTVRRQPPRTRRNDWGEFWGWPAGQRVKSREGDKLSSRELARRSVFRPGRCPSRPPHSTSASRPPPVCLVTRVDLRPGSGAFHPCFGIRGWQHAAYTVKCTLLCTCIGVRGMDNKYSTILCNNPEHVSLPCVYDVAQSRAAPSAPTFSARLRGSRVCVSVDSHPSPRQAAE